MSAKRIRIEARGKRLAVGGRAVFAWRLLALMDMIDEKDWERAISLADGIAQDCRVEAIIAETVKGME